MPQTVPNADVKLSSNWSDLLRTAMDPNHQGDMRQEFVDLLPELEGQDAEIASMLMEQIASSKETLLDLNESLTRASHS